MKTFEYIEEKGYKHEKSYPYEIYVNDPEKVKNPANLITEIYIPVY